LVPTLPLSEKPNEVETVQLSGAYLKIRVTHLPVQSRKSGEASREVLLGRILMGGWIQILYVDDVVKDEGAEKIGEGQH